MPDTTTATSTPSSERPVVGERKTLATYRIPDGDRWIVGQRVNGIVRVIDVPANDRPGRRILVERGLTSKAQLDALVADYVQVSRRRGHPAAIVCLEDCA